MERAKTIASGQAAPLAADVLSLAGLVDRIGRSLNRLDGAADTTFADSSHTALAALSAQLHRGVETVARLQGLGAKTAEPERPTFSISINLPPVVLASARGVEIPGTSVPDFGARRPL